MIPATLAALLALSFMLYNRHRNRAPGPTRTVVGSQDPHLAAELVRAAVERASA